MVRFCRRDPDSGLRGPCPLVNAWMVIACGTSFITFDQFNYHCKIFVIGKDHEKDRPALGMFILQASTSYPIETLQAFRVGWRQKTQGKLQHGWSALMFVFRLIPYFNDFLLFCFFRARWSSTDRSVSTWQPSASSILTDEWIEILWLEFKNIPSVLVKEIPTSVMIICMVYHSGGFSWTLTHTVLTFKENISAVCLCARVRVGLTNARNGVVRDVKVVKLETES